MRRLSARSREGYPRPVTTPPEAYLFDFDGVLVATEPIHFEAYRRALAALGYDLDWDFPRYCRMAHYGSDELRRNLGESFPTLFATTSWDELYADKSRRYLGIVEEGGILLTPGARELLERLAAADAPRAVVTHSQRVQIDALRRQHPILDSVPLWLTREDYDGAKPAPDGYLEALRRLGREAGRCIGFEDTPRGLQSLAAAGVPAVLVSDVAYPDLGGVEPELTIVSLREVPAELLP